LIAMMRQGFRVALFVCVSLSVWQGPLPWLHQHDECPARVQPRLAMHVTAWHAGQPELGGWHLHLATLDDILRGEGNPIPPTEDEEQSQRLFVQSVVAEQNPLSKLGWWIAPAEISAPVQPTATIQPRPDPGKLFPRQFLSDFVISGKFESLLCSRQC
jgi:hypothetical protein